MYKDDRRLTTPPAEAALWRYMSFTKFVSLMIKNALFFARDTLNKAIMARIVLAGTVMADENCLLRVVGDSSILSVSPHRGRCGPGAAP